MTDKGWSDDPMRCKGGECGDCTNDQCIHSMVIRISTGFERRGD